MAPEENSCLHHAFRVCTAILVLLAAICSCQSFTDLCPAPLPCTCQETIIRCDNRNFSNITEFIWTRDQDIFQVLDYSNNMVTEIGIKPFNVLEISTLLLSWNNITTLHDAAFVGLQKRLRYLDLSHNNLKTLPFAIWYLINLVSLDIYDNPIDGSVTGNISTDGFTETVMYRLGSNITSFGFGHVDALRHWPSTLAHFQQLRTLKVIGINSDILRTDSFHGFERTIKILVIEYSLFRKIPSAIESLVYLEELHINHNRYSEGDEILEKYTFVTLNSTLKALSLNYNNLTFIPEALGYLKSLQNLSLIGNKIDLITEESIEVLTYTNISLLTFRHCILKRIPASISRLSGLTDLDFSFNRLVTVEGGDLQNLPNLQRLYLNDNPLRYIADVEFSGLYSLAYLNLSNTKLNIIPEAIHNLISLQVLDVENTAIECTCELTWLKRWLVWFDVSVEIYGQCETIDQSLQRYVNYRLPSCPAYLEQELG